MTNSNAIKMHNEHKKAIADFLKVKRSHERKTINVRLTKKQFELFKVMIDDAKCAIDNGAESYQGFKIQIEQLFRKRVNKKLASLSK